MPSLVFIMPARRGAGRSSSRRAACLLIARPVLRRRVVHARSWDGTRAPRVDGRAICVVDAGVRGRVAIINGRSEAALRRGAITPCAAVGVEDAIAAGCARVRAVVGRRGAAHAGGARRAIRVGGALVVRAPAGADEPFEREATTVRSLRAVGVRRTAIRRLGAVRLGARRGAALAGAACGRSPMVDGDLRVACPACSRFDEGWRTGGLRVVAGAHGTVGGAARDRAAASGEREDEEKDGAEGSHDAPVEHVTCHAQRRGSWRGGWVAGAPSWATARLAVHTRGSPSRGLVSRSAYERTGALRDRSRTGPSPLRPSQARRARRRSSTRAARAPRSRGGRTGRRPRGATRPPARPPSEGTRCCACVR